MDPRNLQNDTFRKSLGTVAESPAALDICMYVCVYVYIYIYIYMAWSRNHWQHLIYVYIYMCIYICVYICVGPVWFWLGGPRVKPIGGPGPDRCGSGLGGQGLK